MQLTIDVVDAFTDTQFKGNSAAVILIDEWLPAATMQSIAAENNLSETAFLVLKNEAYHIRWFSPLTEIDFCGHATLAAASVIFANDPSSKKVTMFAKAVGHLSIEKCDDGFLQMDFPNKMPQSVMNTPEALIQGLSIAPQQVLINQQAYVAVMANREEVLKVTYDTELIKLLAPHDVVVTAVDHEYDFVSRYFWPASGGVEDPVTGSIHTALAPYWGGVLGKQSMIALQASSRGGVLKCELKNERVLISGQTVHYLQGQLTLHNQ